MTNWAPTGEEWKGQDAVLIGGGSSLLGFDFQQLQGKNIIGCNDAFRLGKDLIKFGIFGDASWFNKYKWDLESFGGPVVSCAPSTFNFKLPWLHTMRRVNHGIHKGSNLGWNYSTGAAAVNLALSLGAARIFLLGYDMGTNPAGKTHWHPHGKLVNKGSYQRFLRGFTKVALDLKSGYPLVQVFNVTNGSSLLPNFQKISFVEFRGMLNITL